MASHLAQRRVLLLPQTPAPPHTDAASSTPDGEVLSLPHPLDGLPAAFLLVPSGLHRLAHEFKSWAIGDSLIVDGSLHVASPFDPLLLLLPILDLQRTKTAESAGRFLQRSDLIYSQDFPGLERLADSMHTSILARICDVQEIEGISTFFRLNDDKALAWLKAKVDRVAANADKLEAFEPLMRHYAQAERVAVKQRLAFDSVAEYLNEKWASLLKTHLGLVDDAQSSGPIVYFDSSAHSKRSGDSKELSASQPSAKKAALSKGQRSIAKASKTGMKPLTSFFKPAPSSSQ
ncbi:ribonuclease H2, subunit B [Entophlyctis helioformis]|nr:ribonuclease H2, subunit B [Entophlyctis helioformis]